MDASIIIATANRASELRETLASLAGIERGGSMELIVVDDRSTDYTRQVVAHGTNWCPFFVRYLLRRGLLGRDRLDPGAALVIAPCNSIHMFFMRFAIDVVYVDCAGRVRKIVQALRPWRISVAMSAYAVIELGAGSLEGCDIERGDRLYVEVPAPA